MITDMNDAMQQAAMLSPDLKTYVFVAGLFVGGLIGMAIGFMLERALRPLAGQYAALASMASVGIGAIATSFTSVAMLF